MICPKCNHQRSNNDDPLTPDYRCPACDIVYAKYKPPGSNVSDISSSVIANIQLTKKQIKPAVFIADETPKIGHENSQRQPDIIDGEFAYPFFTNRLKIILALILILIIIATSYVSPGLFMRDFRESLFEKNASDLTNYIDFEKLKINTKATIIENINQTTEQKSNPFNQIGQSIGLAMVDTMLNQAISPAGIKALFNQQTADVKKASGMPIFDFIYVDFNRVNINNGETVIKLDRKGFFSWIIVAIEKKSNKVSSINIASSQRESITAALDLFRLDNGRYPTTVEGLKALIIKPDGLRNWKGPYINPSAIDGFQYQGEGLRVNKYTLWT